MGKFEAKRVIFDRITELSQIMSEDEAVEIVLGAFGWMKLESGCYRARGASGEGITPDECVDYMASVLTGIN